jgi:hypothetical protein
MLSLRKERLEEQEKWKKASGKASGWILGHVSNTIQSLIPEQVQIDMDALALIEWLEFKYSQPGFYRRGLLA